MLYLKYKTRNGIRIDYRFAPLRQVAELNPRDKARRSGGVYDEKDNPCDPRGQRRCGPADTDWDDGLYYLFAVQ